MTGETSSIGAVGLIWYRPQDYPRILEVMEDADDLPATYGEWYEKTRDIERYLKRNGYFVVRTLLDPEAFPGWCRSRGLKVNAKARAEFANAAAYDKINKP